MSYLFVGVLLGNCGEDFSCNVNGGILVGRAELNASEFVTEKKHRTQRTVNKRVITG